MTHPLSFPLAAIVLATLSACSTLPPDQTPLALARSEHQAARDNPQTASLAPSELQQADAAMQRANQAEAAREPEATITHLAYLARQRATIAQEVGRQKAAEQRVSDANAVRDRMQLEARTHEADTARQQTLAAQEQTRSAQDQTRMAEDQTRAAEQRNRELQDQIKELNARATPRGWVITLGDVLFGSGQASLKSGNLRSVDKLAEFLQRNPQRHVLIEGYTDSTGSDSGNLDLSARRSEAVRTALVDRGVNPQRIATRGYGESHPVADNGSAGGRQLNRRVEIIVSNDSGPIPAR
ncbi:MAG: OmpA family protein [Hylemonella sp.]|uniref:OmpA family protein n=1 Tax=Hylemonella sp. TaxID=2066020 RepID=UPI0022C6B08E|nr:OmpA family protein [Hylemonella sp.]MCZ8252341.1 OmpA family protein [Hylemonella sp.]